MKRFVIGSAWRLCLACLWLAPVAQALEDDGKSLEAGENVTVITAERLIFDYKNKYALFENDVVVMDPRMQMSAKKLTVTFTDKGDASVIKAEGGVLLTQGDKKAKANVATYDVATGKIVLAGGKPRVMRGRDLLEGDVITFWRDEQRLECQPRARLVIYPDDSRDVDSFLLGP